MSGREVNDMSSEKKDALVIWINLLIVWSNFEKWGSLVLITENEPMTLQVNQFLKKTDFEGEKVEFLIRGDNSGG